MRNVKKKAVIFDLDGTLWDAADTIAPVWNACLQSRGISRRFSPDECRGFCGKTLEQIAALAFPEMETRRREELLLACCMAENAPLSQRGGRLYPNLIPVLEALRERYFLAVVSNCQEGYIEAFFQGNRVGQLFDDYESAGRTGLTKAENIRLVMERNGIERAVYMGDTEGDRQAALLAGIPFIHAAYGYGQVSGADLVIRRMEELCEILDNLIK